MLNKINLVLVCLLISGNLIAQKSKGIIELPSEVSAPLTNSERLQLLEVFGDSFSSLVMENPTQLQNLKFHFVDAAFALLEWVQLRFFF